MGQQQMADTLAMVKSYAVQHHVPIMEEQGIAELTQLLDQQKPASILEIGSAIGFSAIKMAQALPLCKIDTIERDEGRCAQARKFISDSGCGERIRVFQADALEMDISLLEPSYDAIFIDAAKGQYERFFEKYEKLVPEGGIIYCDNMLMHGMADRLLADIPRRKRTMIRNIKKFRERMMDHPRYEAELLPVGDGIMVCTKKSQ